MLYLPRDHERFCVAVFTCWDVFPDPGTLLEQPTICVTTGNLNCELRFIPSPMRGEGAVRKGRTCILCVWAPDKSMESSERRNVEFFIILLYLYGDLEYPFGKYKVCFVSWTHGCLLLVCTRELSQPVCSYCRKWRLSSCDIRKSSWLWLYDLVISKDCIYVTFMKYMYFYNDCEIHFSLTMTASFIDWYVWKLRVCCKRVVSASKQGSWPSNRQNTRGDRGAGIQAFLALPHCYRGACRLLSAWCTANGHSRWITIFFFFLQGKCSGSSLWECKSVSHSVMSNSLWPHRL